MNTKQTRKKMNQNFIVKINGNGISVLVGWQGLVSFVGRGRAFLLVYKALKSEGDKYTWRSRRGLIVRFYLK